MSTLETNKKDNGIDDKKFDNVNSETFLIANKMFKDASKTLISSCHGNLIQHTSLVLVTDSIISAYSIS